MCSLTGGEYASIIDGAGAVLAPNARMGRELTKSVFFVKSVETGAVVNFANVFEVSIEKPSVFAEAGAQQVYSVKAVCGGVQGEYESPVESTLFRGSEAECKVYEAWLHSELHQAGVLIDTPSTAAIRINLEAYLAKLERESAGE